MLVKKYLNKLSVVYYNLKSIGKSFFVPFVFVYIVIIMLSVCDKLQGFDTYTCYKNTYLKIQFFCPFFAIWWAVFGFREHIEGKCREILLVYKKSILSELLTVYFLYFINIPVLLLLCYILLQFNYFAFLFIFFVQSFAFFSFAVSLSVLIKNIALPFIICILYEIFCMTANTELTAFINMLSVNIPQDTEGILYPYIFIFAGSVILFVLSNLRFKRL